MGAYTATGTQFNTVNRGSGYGLSNSQYPAQYPGNSVVNDTSANIATGPQFITGNGYLPYNPQYPGGYGGNAAAMAWQYASRDPLALKETTIQMAPHPSYSQSDMLVNLLGYAWEDFKQIDGLRTGVKDKMVDLSELTAYFQRAVHHPQSAEKLAKTWMAGYDTDKNNVLTVDEHLASNVFELGATTYLQRLGGHLHQAMTNNQYTTAAQQSMVDRQLRDKALQLFAHITPFSTPAERTVKEKALLKQTSLVNKITDSIQQGLQLKQYAKAFRLLPGQPDAPPSHVMSYQA